MAKITKSRLKARGVSSVVLFHNERKPEAVHAFRAAQRMLKRRGARVFPGSGKNLGERLSSCEMAIALGGDGTVLRVARIIAPFSVPLLGVNTGGGLGFLSAVDMGGFKRNFKRICAGEFSVGLRAMLSVEVSRGGDIVFGPYVALNDCVIRGRHQARAVTMKAFSANRYVAVYFGDGLIISTPTGSTAYALAVGGPVIDPSLEAFLLAPISPHALTQRPLILPAEDALSIHMAQRHPHDKTQALVALDGQLECPLKVGDQVHVRRYEKPFKLLLDPRRSYFELLREKLKWGER